jgi:hypothetical protein
MSNLYATTIDPITIIVAKIVPCQKYSFGVTQELIIMPQAEEILNSIIPITIKNCNRAIRRLLFYLIYIFVYFINIFCLNLALKSILGKKRAGDLI